MKTVLSMLAMLASNVAFASCTVISGATLFDGADNPKGTSLAIVDGRIAAIGQGLEQLKLDMEAGEVKGATYAGQDCEFVQAGGLYLSAGLVEVATQLGVVEVELEGGTRDDGAPGEWTIRSGLQVADAYNPNSSVIPVQHSGGLALAVSRPDGGRISGQGALVQLAGRTQADAVLRRDAAMFANLGGPSKASALAELRRVLDLAKLYQRDPKAALAQRRPHDPAAQDLAALAPVLQGKQPLAIGANRASDIEAVLRLQKDYGLKLILDGGAEAWMHAEALAAAKIPVVVDPYVYGPGSFDQLQGRKDNAALLAEAGVPLILTSKQSHNARTLRQVAGNAVRAGLSQADALEAITRTPAEVFGAPDRARLEVGAAADVVLWTGDPLELSSQVRGLWIGGERQSLVNRQTLLRDKYMTLPGTPEPALSLPE